jgi:hypothetical protein
MGPSLTKSLCDPNQPPKCKSALECAGGALNMLQIITQNCTTFVYSMPSGGIFLSVLSFPVTDAKLTNAVNYYKKKTGSTAQPVCALPVAASQVSKYDGMASKFVASVLLLFGPPHCSDCCAFYRYMAMRATYGIWNPTNDAFFKPKSLSEWTNMGNYLPYNNP